MKKPIAIAILSTAIALPAFGDETCNSPYMTAPHQGPGRLRPRLDARREGPRRRPGQARHDRRQPEVEGLRQGGLDACPSARAARRTTWASPTTAATSGPAGSTDNKIYVFDVGRSREAEARAHDQEPRREDRLRRPAHLLRDARPHADRHALEHEGQGRRHRHGGLQQQGRLRREVRHADRQGRRRLRLRHRDQPREERAAHLELHRAATTTCAPSASSSRTPRR